MTINLNLILYSLVVSASQDAGGYVISLQNNLELHLGHHTWPYLLIELFYIGMPVVQTDGLSGGVQSRDYQIFSDG